MGFSEFLPTPVLPLSEDAELEGEWIEPDFLAFDDRTRQWVIIELKTPDEALVTKAKRRQKLRASVATYIAQVSEYAEYFDDAAHRKLTKEAHGISVAKTPDIYLLVGYGDDLDAVHRIASRQGRNIKVWQYNTLLTGLIERYDRQFEPQDTAPGISAHMVASIDGGNPAGRAYIFDLGRSRSRDRFSLFVVDGEKLGVEVTDDSGSSTYLELPIGDNFGFDQKLYIHFEFVSSEAMSLLSISVNGRFTRRAFIQRRLKTKKILGKLAYFVGADLDGRHGAKFKLFELACYSQSQTFRDRVDLYDYFWRKYFAEELAKNNIGLKFSKTAFSYQNLPNSDLIQTDERLKPEVDDPKNWSLTKKIFGDPT